MQSTSSVFTHWIVYDLLYIWSGRVNYQNCWCVGTSRHNNGCSYHSFKERPEVQGQIKTWLSLCIWVVACCCRLHLERNGAGELGMLLLHPPKQQQKCQDVKVGVLPGTFQCMRREKRLLLRQLFCYLFSSKHVAASANCSYISVTTSFSNRIPYLWGARDLVWLE